jgi:ribonuclease HI
MTDYKVYTDGACEGNPGPGGWGAIIKTGNTVKIVYGGKDNTTNNQMEMLAVIKAMMHIPQGSNIVIVTDSTYVKDGITKWIQNWKRNGWKTAKGKPVKNKQLWEKMNEEMTRHGAVSFEWVKGHSGNPNNELADKWAGEGIQLMRQTPKVYADQISFESVEAVDALTAAVNMDITQFLNTLKELKAMQGNKHFKGNISFWRTDINSVNVDTGVLVYGGLELYYDDVKHLTVEEFKQGFTVETTPFNVIRD